MKRKATRWTKAQRCEIIGELSKPNVSSEWATFDDANDKDWCAILSEDVDGVLETVRIEAEPPIVNGIQPIETFVKSESATEFKGFEALHNIVLDINDQLIRSEVQMEAR